MRIGLDVRHLTHPQEGGFKTYTESLVSAITRVDTKNDYVFYTDRPAKNMQFGNAHVQVRVVQGSLPVREQIALPIAIARDRVELLHCMCNTAPLLSRCPLVVTIHDVIPCLPEPNGVGLGGRARLLDKYWREVIPLAATRAARVVTVSESSAQDIQRILGVPRERIEAIHNGIDSAFRVMQAASVNEALRNSDLPAERFMLGFLSKDGRKNVSGLLQAFRILSRQALDCGLVLVGSSREVVNMLPEETLRDPRITLLIAVSKEKLVALYNSASVLVFPSFAEGFGLPIVEAMACGTPVVTSDISSAHEVAGEAALFVDPHNARAIAEAALAVLTSESLRTRMRTAGLGRAEQFSWDATARRLVATYAAVLSASEASSRCAAKQVEQDQGGPAADPAPQYPEVR